MTRALVEEFVEEGFARRDRTGVRGRADGDKVADLHVWRLGPGHLGAIVSIFTTNAREAEFYRGKLASFRSLSHLTVEVTRRA